jgi:hypothetical protein
MFVWPKCLYCCSIHFPVGCHTAEFVNSLLVSTCALQQHLHYLGCRSLVLYSKKNEDILQDTCPQYDCYGSEWLHSVRNPASRQFCHKIALPKQPTHNNKQCSSDIPWRRLTCWLALLIKYIILYCDLIYTWAKIKKIYFFKYFCLLVTGYFILFIFIRSMLQKYKVHQWFGRICDTVFSGSATLWRMPLSPFCCQL